MTRKIAVFPDTRREMYDAYTELVAASAAEQVDLGEADGLLWADPATSKSFPTAIAAAPNVTWIQLPYAGVESFLRYLDNDHTWTCAKGVYSEPVAEHAIGLAIAGMRNLHEYSRAKTWSGPVGTNLLGANVAILGAGGITESLLRLLAPWDCRTTVVRRQAKALAGADLVVSADELHATLRTADLVIIALALTADTRHIIDEAALDAMKPTAWIVNVGRGQHIDTTALVNALQAGSIGGAALDVTDPEPLPTGHELWSLPNCIITPHTANTPEMGLVLLKLRVAENLRRFCADEPLLGLIDVAEGY